LTAGSVEQLEASAAIARTLKKECRCSRREMWM
jgi:hypothetical protein